jgi:cytochrome bd-type quinol oxidase subunit 2
MANNKRYAQQKIARQKCRLYNAVCALFLCITLLLFFCAYFIQRQEGTVTENASGFETAFLLLRGDLGKMDRVLSVVNINNSGAVAFASVTSLLCLIAVLALIIWFLYRSAAAKPLLSKALLPVIAATLVLFILQTIACGSLTSLVKNEYMDITCVNCITSSLSYLSMIMYIVFLVGFTVMSYSLADNGIVFKV